MVPQNIHFGPNLVHKHIKKKMSDIFIYLFIYLFISNYGWKSVDHY